MGAELTLRGVRHRRGDREVLRIDQLDIAAGERLSVLGPNGAGKTTLLRLLAAVEPPSTGTIAIDGLGTASGGVELRRRVAYATQRAGLLSTSVRRNVELPLQWRKVPRRRRRDLAVEALERLRVAHLADRPARALSGGEQQRVSLARALVLDPAVLLLDEPAAGLDAQSRAAFFADLDQALADRSVTVVQVSHRAEEALGLADRVVVLLAGQVHQIGTPETLNRHPVDAGVAALVGYENLVEAEVGPDGTVLVGATPTGLTCDRPAGPVTVAAFASGVRLVPADWPGLPVRVARVSPGPGHRTVALSGAVSLLAHVPVRAATSLLAGSRVRVVFDPALSTILPRS
ncbi:ABC transporter related protein [Kribbella flavida DSM 17836]|uniref:ABC transporter related protein n=1 Tax=Kribbella flavida (strain DSM 17836 / JCM 10339 / NBRC 14399) TaxID=479435 RepID=D2PS81_KRIFD|nr:ABC transporter ATP-binding protein [Kribbella flavida]ADB31205.1 ABC transporter related protein [Kribbella flavida DSM 17836]